MCGYEEVHQLINEHQSSLLYYADLLLGDPDEAQRAVQLAFIRWIRARRKNPSVRVKQPLVRLLACLRGVCAESAGFRKAAPSRVFSPDHGFTPGDAAARTIRGRIGKLSPQELELLVLHYAFALRYEELSEITGLPVPRIADGLHHVFAALTSSSEPEKHGGLS